jgi:hypothetical protein
MTKDVAAQKIITACHHAQAGGLRIHGISGPDGLTTWTGMTESQVWSGLNALRDAATQYGTDLIAYTNHYYTVGDTDACMQWLVARSKYITTAIRRVEEMGMAVAAVTGYKQHAKVAHQAHKAVREIDQLVADLLAAI